MKERKQNLQKNLPKNKIKQKKKKTNKHYAQRLELNIVLFRFPKPTLLSFYSNGF